MEGNRAGEFYTEEMMLVLSRKKHEGIIIGHKIEIVVLSIHGNTVRLGITAPEGTRILRDELKEETNIKEDHRG